MNKIYLTITLIILFKHCFGQKEIDLKTLNEISNNRFYIEYYSKKKINDSLYFYLDKNYSHFENLFYRDLSDMAYYYMKNNDSLKSIKSVNQAILYGLDSVTIERYFGNIEFYKTTLKKRIFENFKYYSNIYKSNLDSLLIHDYETLYGLDQALRNSFWKKTSSTLKEYIVQLIKHIDTTNFNILKSFIANNQGLGLKGFGNYYSEFWVLYLHTSDYSEENYKFLENYILKEIKEGNLSTYDFFMLFKRHLRDKDIHGNCSNYLVGDINKDNIKCNCKEIEQNWEKNGLGSFKIYRNYINTEEIICSE